MAKAMSLGWDYLFVFIMASAWCRNYTLHVYIIRNLIQAKGFNMIDFPQITVSIKALNEWFLLYV